MYIPTGLAIVLVLWFLTDGDKRPLPGWLCAIGLIAFAGYNPGMSLVFLAIAAVILVPLGLFFLYAAGMHLLEKGAKAMPDCWLFDGPLPQAEPPDVLIPEVMDLRVDRARRALRACAHR